MSQPARGVAVLQAAVDGAGGAARVPAEGVQGQQASVHGERGAAVEAAQRRPAGQPPPRLAHLALRLAAQLRLLPRRRAAVAQIAGAAVAPSVARSSKLGNNTATPLRASRKRLARESTSLDVHCKETNVGKIQREFYFIFYFERKKKTKQRRCVGTDALAERGSVLALSGFSSKLFFFFSGEKPNNRHTSGSVHRTPLWL